jgi:hypothetical protein
MRALTTGSAASVWTWPSLCSIASTARFSARISAVKYSIPSSSARSFSRASSAEATQPAYRSRTRKPVFLAGKASCPS